MHAKNKNSSSVLVENTILLLVAFLGEVAFMWEFSKILDKILEGVYSPK
jgi:hypothetical protein